MPSAASSTHSLTLPTRGCLGLETQVRGKVPEQLRIEYVTQDSHLVVSETVLDVMWFYASLSLPRGMSVRDKRRLIDDILFAMDMSHTVDTYVGGVESAYEVLIEGGLSSGERRRLQVRPFGSARLALPPSPPPVASQSGSEH
jgi:ABC-type multidrug transport system ATPase subunit